LQKRTFGGGICNHNLTVHQPRGVSKSSQERESSPTPQTKLNIASISKTVVWLKNHKFSVPSRQIRITPASFNHRPFREKEIESAIHSLTETNSQASSLCA
jgi:hypothetical protein